VAPEPEWAAYDAATNVLMLRVHVVPGARRTAPDGIHGNRLKIRLAARPIDGEANAALCEFVAAAFGVPKRSVVLMSGVTSRAKTLRVDGPVLRPDRAWSQAG
jgi:uncharacterized protein (TIGR00251 family)